MEYRRLPLGPHGMMLKCLSLGFLTPGLNFVVHTVYCELIFNRICNLMGFQLKLRCISACLSVNIIRFDSRLTYFYKTLSQSFIKFVAAIQFLLKSDTNNGRHGIW